MSAVDQTVSFAAAKPASAETPGRRVLVVMPAYNAAKTLERTYRDIPHEIVDRIILVDDVSRDDTVAVARQLGLDKEAAAQHQVLLGIEDRPDQGGDASGTAVSVAAVIAPWLADTRWPTSADIHGV